MTGTLTQGTANLAALWRPEAPVHVWYFCLDRWAMTAEHSPLELLGEEERQRARSMSMLLQRHRYMAAHACMRQIVAAYCGVEPAALRYRYGAFGKPRLADPAQARELAVNLAYAAGAAPAWAALAVSRRDEVGLALSPSAAAAPANADEALVKLAWLKANGQSYAASVKAVKFPMRDWFCERLLLGAGLSAALVAAGPEAQVAVGLWTPRPRRQIAAA
ncbi:MAG: 4'-phosphopantetheinyl transferase family protein [Terriglobales bacterium]